ncbi:MAG: hypothetical protein LBK61_03760 [Spirochaetaceae bacterium]|jgi:hypothetical protein|nr:hypothetical protein [Spirochaetaceae bacterium]
MKNNLDLLPPVKRARAYRLYTESKRFVDLYLDGGRAVLGHNAPNVLRELKNAADRSLFAPYPSCYTKRFEKALSQLFPGKSFAVYGSLEAVPSATRNGTPLIRPYMASSGDDPFLALLPHPLAPVVLVTSSQCGRASEKGGVAGGGPPVEGVVEDPARGLERGVGNASCRDFPLLISPVILALTTRAIYDVLHTPERSSVLFKRVEEALADGPWRREGIYVTHRGKLTDDEWERIFRRFLDAGFLIPPTQHDPLILPGELSPGEENLLAACFR